MTVTCIKEIIVGGHKAIGAGGVEGGVGGCGNYVYIHFYKTQKQNKTKQNPTLAVNNTVNKLTLDRGSCEKLHKKLSLPTSSLRKAFKICDISNLISQEIADQNREPRPSC